MLPDQLPEDIPAEELMRVFVGATTISLEKIAEAYRSIEKGDSQLGVPLLRRLSHNLKGSSYQFGFTELGVVSSHLEALTENLLGRLERISSEDHTALAAGVECLHRLFHSLATGEPPPDSGPVCRMLESRVE
jgi:hypothetical protein